MQRLGRKGHPVYRVVVQDSRQSPDSGKYVAMLGSYDPHTKATTLNKEKAELFLKNGAQPSDRVVSLFKAEKVKLPAWVKEPIKQKREIRNPEKLRKNRPADAVVEEAAPETEAETADSPTESAEAEAPQEKEEQPAQESSDTKPEAEGETAESTPEEKPASEPDANAEQTKPEEAEKPAEDSDEKA